jgi:hypothetical protein
MILVMALQYQLQIVNNDLQTLSLSTPPPPCWHVGASPDFLSLCVWFSQHRCKLRLPSGLCNGVLSRFYAEAKSFKLICEEGVSVAQVFERSRCPVHSVPLGCVSVK